MNENQKSNAALPLEWDREWYRHDVQTTDDDIEAHYDRGGIVIKTKFVDGNEPTNVAFCYSEEVIIYLKQIQQAGAGFDAKAYLEGIAGDIARGDLERGHALVRLMAYTLSQPISFAENIMKHVGVKDQVFLVGDDGRGELPDEVCELMLKISSPEKFEAATGDEPTEAGQTDQGPPLFVEEAGVLRLVDKWWIDRAQAWQNGTLKSAVMHFLPETLEEFEIMNAERAKDGLPPTSKEDMQAYCDWIARRLGMKPQLH